MPAGCGRGLKARLRWASLPLLADGAASVVPSACHSSSRLKSVEVIVDGLEITRTEATERHTRERALAIFQPLTTKPIRRRILQSRRDRLSRFRSAGRSW